MYLARSTREGETRFILRQSFRQGNVFRSRDLFDLGVDPGRYIVYPGGNAFYIDEEIEDRLADLGLAGVGLRLEELLMPFVRRDLRDKLADFSRRPDRIVSSPLTPGEQEAIRRRLHIFDKRRQYYLRYGNIDQTRMGRVPAKLFRVLLDKSRDELEQYFSDQERVLEPADYKEYVYVIFDLQRHFSELIARAFPQGLNPVMMDEVFLRELCDLDADASFWAGFERDAALPAYLARYVVMFFDYGFMASTGWDEYVRQFMDSHRRFRWPEGQGKKNLDRAAELFGEEIETLKEMSKRELTRLFRRKAHDHHPDKGGEHDYFVELAAAYQELLKGKK